ncbi:MAG TPA: OsmC family protein [Opitutales bacterium]|nr:OsmC family protein [Opitutales bacterium]
MVTITAEYLGDLHCRAVHQPSGATIETDAPKDNQGRGEAFSPTDLCATSLLTCMATVMGIQARTLGYDLAGLKMEVRKEMTPPPRRIARLSLDFQFPRPADPATRERLQQTAETCPVHRSLSHDVVVETKFSWPQP